jgi:hypothetical protein
MHNLAIVPTYNAFRWEENFKAAGGHTIRFLNHLLFLDTTGKFRKFAGIYDSE